MVRQRCRLLKKHNSKTHKAVHSASYAHLCDLTERLQLQRRLWWLNGEAALQFSKGSKQTTHKAVHTTTHVHLCNLTQCRQLERWLMQQLVDYSNAKSLAL
jgi:hypothetical protein